MAIWSCKIGEQARDILPDGADGPLRAAVEEAYRKLTGETAEFCFSGWGGQLTDDEQEVVNEDRQKRIDVENPDDLLYTAFAIIANAWEGCWDQAPDEWREAAERWRDRWHKTF